MEKSMKRYGIVFFLAVFFVMARPIEAEGMSLEWPEVNEWLEETDENLFFERWQVNSMEELIERLLAGELDLSVQSMAQICGTIFWTEMGIFLGRILTVAAFAILSYLLQQLSAEFAGSSLGEAAFLAVYAGIIVQLLSSLSVPAEETQTAFETISYLSTMLIPALLAFAAASGSISSGIGQSTLILSGFRFSLLLLEEILLPLTLGIGVAETVNYLHRKTVLERLLRLGRAVIRKGLRGICLLFIVLTGMVGMVLPTVDRWIRQAGGTILSSVPVVGGAVAGAMDTVLAGTAMIKNGVGAGACLLILGFCLLPLSRIAAAWLAYRLMGAIVAPVSDPRVSGLIDAMGQTASMLLSLLTAGMMLFVGAVGIFLYSTT
jgi:stage III sporulation protein AE